MIVREMRDTECFEVIRAEQIGRLACSQEGQPYVVPIRYAYSENCIFSFSMPGKKIDIRRSNEKVCIEIEELGNTHDWRCVVIDGAFRELPSTEERQHAWELLQMRNDWWEPGALKPGPQHLAAHPSHVYFKVEFGSVTGRQARSD